MCGIRPRTRCRGRTSWATETFHVQPSSGEHLLRRGQQRRRTTAVDQDAVVPALVQVCGQCAEVRPALAAGGDDAHAVPVVGEQFGGEEHDVERRPHVHQICRPARTGGHPQHRHDGSDADPAGEEGNQALNKVYGQVKCLERGAPGPGETMETAAQAQYEVWEMLRTMRTAMRQDLGVSRED